MFFLLLFLALAGGCGKGGSSGSDATSMQPVRGDSQHGDILVDFTIANPPTLNPLTAIDAVERQISALVFNGLVKFDKNYKVIPDLAESWEFSPDFLHLLFHIRPGVKWHDGTLLTADDVAFTCDRIRDPATGSPDRSLFLSVATLEIVEPLTVRVHYSEPYAWALESWAVKILPRHVFEQISPGSISSKEPPMVGTGPFKFIKWDQHEQIVLHANTDYFEQRPFLDGYTLRIIPDWSMAFLALKKGDIDIMKLNPDQFEKHAGSEEFRSGFQIFRYPRNAVTFIGYNNKGPILSDRSIRKALTLSLDRAEIVKRVLYGSGHVSTGPFSSIHPGNDPFIRPLPFDTSEAISLLSSSGWKDSDGDGILDKNGVPLRFELCTNHANNTRQLISCFAAESWQKIGIKVTVSYLEWGVLLDKLLTGDFDAVLINSTFYPYSDPYNDWHTASIPGRGLGNEGNNYFAYSNPESDLLLEKARCTINAADRTAILRKFHGMLHSDQPATFLYTDEDQYAVDKRFRNVCIASDGILQGVQNWSVPPELRKYR
ncbi:MAG: peptide-binding protein [Candidatus Wallbacteria bacterium]|nr:peptide-binding protein [Candidatus Wallbacteria bacterium]